MSRHDPLAISPPSDIPEQCDESVRCFDAEVWGPLDKAIDLAEQAVDQAASVTAAREVFVDLRDRLVGYRCYAMTLRNLSAWIAGVHGYLKADTEAGKQSRLTMVQEMVASELANAKALLKLWESSVVDFMPLNAYTETMHDYGVNFGEVLQRKIALMEQYGDRLLWGYWSSVIRFFVFGYIQREGVGGV